MNCDYCNYRIATHRCSKCNTYVCLNCIVYNRNTCGINGVIYKHGKIYDYERGWYGIKPLKCNHNWNNPNIK